MLILLNILIVAVIIFIIYWFFLYKPKPAKLIDAGEVTIVVENGVYQPNRIAAIVGQPLTIHFQLKDDAHCAKKVIFSDFDVSVELNKEQVTDILITPTKTGEFQFACPMAMYKGTLEVKPAPAIEIIVDGGVYQPNVIATKLGNPINLRFIRKDPSRCAQTVIFPELGQALELPFNEPVDINLAPKEPGEYKFSCEMGMYQGKLIVEPG